MCLVQFLVLDGGKRTLLPPFKLPPAVLFSLAAYKLWIE